MLIDRFEHKETLAKLWHNVFGDSYAYIELIFNKACDESILCFAELESGKAISAFYLLGSKLFYKGNTYRGYYLYAAATDEGYRGKGLMSSLIKEAELYCENNGYDFISLVPSEKSLYGYYRRFGFLNSMYCFVADRSTLEELCIITPDEYCLRRKELCSNYMMFDSEAFIYASDCLKAAGYNFYKSGESIAIKNDEGDIVELLSPEDNNNERFPFGMLYPINSALNSEREYPDIYMNIALD